MLDDETLRDGLQSPSVRVADASTRRSTSSSTWTGSASTPPTSACRAPGRRSRGTSSAWRARSAEGRLRIRANCAARTHGGRHQADRRDPAAHRRADRVRRVHRIEPDPPVRRGLDARLPARSAPRTRWRSPSKEGVDGDVRHRGHDARRSRNRCGRLFHDRDPRRRQRACASPTRSGHATPNGARAVVDVREVA